MSSADPSRPANDSKSPDACSYWFFSSATANQRPSLVRKTRLRKPSSAFCCDQLENDNESDLDMNGTGDAFKMNQLASPSPISSQITMGIANQLQQPLCCLFEDGHRCTRVAGTSTYPKRIDKQLAQRKLRLTVDQRAGHFFMCDHHKQMVAQLRGGKRKRKDSDDDNSNDVDCDSQLDVDLCSLQVNTLRRYKRHYRIQTRPGLNKAQLAEILMRHFKSIPIYEKEAITYFIYMVKCNKNKLDNIKGSALPID